MWPRSAWLSIQLWPSQNWHGFGPWVWYRGCFQFIVLVLYDPLLASTTMNRAWCLSGSESERGAHISCHKCQDCRSTSHKHQLELRDLQESWHTVLASYTKPQRRSSKNRHDLFLSQILPCSCLHSLQPPCMAHQGREHLLSSRYCYQHTCSHFAQIGS